MKYTDKVKGLKEKAKALEDSFFAKENERILRELREAAALEEKKREFRETLNVKNDEVLEALIELELDAETVVALTLVPLVTVAWADGEIQEKERNAILEAAVENGLGSDSPAIHLLENWLRTKPGAELYETWKSYIDELMHILGNRSQDHIKVALVGRARSVAEAAGGFLGIGSISAAERTTLEEIEQALG
jgi:tellurite resistance protein